MTYTAEEYAMCAAALEQGHTISDGIILAALKIAANVMKPGLIEAELASYAGSVTHEDDVGRAEAIRAAVLAEDSQ